VAAEYGNIDAAKLLLDRGADVNARAMIDQFGIGGQTPIFHAVTQFGDWGLPVAKVLIDRGADLTVRAKLPGHYERPDEFALCWNNPSWRVVVRTGEQQGIISLIAVHFGFGLAHAYQGVTGIIDEGLSGLLLGVIYLRTGRNLSVPIIAHGIGDSIDFVLIFLGEYPGM
jgi:ankyrin repeat protein